MSLTAVVIGSNQEVSSFFCSECSTQNGENNDYNNNNYWSIPQSAWPALSYNVLFTSVIGYGILSWVNSNQSITGTFVMIYTVLQPVTAAIITFVLVYVFQLYSSCNNTIIDTDTDTVLCLDPPGLGTCVGTFGVFVGLYLVVGTEPKGEVVSTSTTYAYNHTESDDDNGNDTADNNSFTTATLTII